MSALHDGQKEAGAAGNLKVATQRVPRSIWYGSTGSCLVRRLEQGDVYRCLLALASTGSVEPGFVTGRPKPS